MRETKIPGLKAKHAIIRDPCRIRGDEAAVDEGLARLRREAVELLKVHPAGKGHQLHLVLTVELGEN